jgi:hypothetical protein
MNSLMFVTFGAVLLLFLANSFLFLFFKPSEEFEAAFSKWKLMLFVTGLSVLFFAINFVVCLNAMTGVMSLSDGFDTFVYSDTNNLVVGQAFLDLGVVLTAINVMFALAYIVLEFQVFGRGRFSKSYLQNRGISYKR